MAIAENTIKKMGPIGYIKKIEYEIILLVYLLARFIFKNILGLAKYFTEQPVFGLSNVLCIVLGALVVLTICVCLACFLGQLIRKNKTDFEKPVLILVALFFACPATLPFLFDTNSLSGTQLLYPFALFILALWFIGKRFFEWLVPVICIIFFIPSLFTSEVFFTTLRKEAILYVPLILLFLFLDMMKNTDFEIAKRKQGKKPAVTAKSQTLGIDPTMFINSLVVSAGSYIYTMAKSNIRFGESVFDSAQKIDIYLAACLLLTAPLLFAFSAVINYAVKAKFSKLVFNVYFCLFILLFPLFWNNYYGLWVPFLTISLSMVVFFNVWQKNPAMLSAARTLGDFFSKRELLFLFFIIVMASSSNTSTYGNSIMFSKILQNLFYTIPF